MSIDELTLKKAQELLGVKLSGEWKESVFSIGNSLHKLRSQKISQDSHDYLKTFMSEINVDSYRIIIEGGIYTQDIRSDRLNVKVDKDFLIINVYIG